MRRAPYTNWSIWGCLSIEPSEGKIAQRAFGGHTSNFGKAPVKRACFAADRTGRVILDTLWEQCLQRDIKFFDEFHVLIPDC